MSLTETDEEREASRRERRGERWGYDRALKEIEKWLEGDGGMISVMSVREKIKSMRKQGAP
jgi:hypothetical protein